MKQFICLYSVDALDLDEKEKTCYGFLFANSFVDAVKQIENTLYGDDLTKINEIELFDSTPEVSKEIYKMLKEELS